MKTVLYFSVLLVSFFAEKASSADYTWIGTTALLDEETNWNPLGGPPSSFGPDNALFDAGGSVKLGLSPNGTVFSSQNVTFSGASYSFASPALGDSINIGTGSLGTLIVSSGASVNFNGQTVALNNSMNWAISGNSTVQGGVVTALELSVGLSFASLEANVVRFTSLALGSAGTLSINNWGGTLGVYGGTNNQLRFTTDPTSFLSKISFTGYSGTVATQNQGGYFEVIAVPEPKTWLMLALGLTVIVVFRRRQKA